ncbi:MAG: hypothetical protein CMB80_20195 [Flammeovirgaceae bacterium]|nr:hypothetical protein [Flammeovirgaceae bacterium]MBE61038.1 hypothetical protein [Flammeovirgaceae bacterium]MBR08381.1 hypothetical protein [Rickettsiales bacterium]HCX21083.1 hypothetical protein [Cytophagales bacterium]|tara:strand:- start:685 stop:876 length:192 start_codon:yes stop_codon:yes gene_type:complete
MKIEEKVRQHEELLAELIHLNEEGSRRLKIMENIQVVFIPTMVVLVATALVGLGFLASSLGLF